MNRRMTAVLAVLALATAGGAGIAAANGGFGLDDGKDLAAQADITQQQAEKAAQSAASGSLGETDLEHHEGTLVYNVDVGSKDVKVDASTGRVVAVSDDD